jgi:hypothetical protein
MHQANGLPPSGGQSHMPSVVNGINGIARSYEYPEQTPEGPYQVLDQYHSKPRRLRVVSASLSIIEIHVQATG